MLEFDRCIDWPRPTGFRCSALFAGTFPMAAQAAWRRARRIVFDQAANCTCLEAETSVRSFFVLLSCCVLIHGKMSLKRNEMKVSVQNTIGALLNCFELRCLAVLQKPLLSTVHLATVLVSLGEYNVSRDLLFGGGSRGYIYCKKNRIFW